MNINQFGQSAVVGERGMSNGFGNVISCMFNPNASGALSAGQAVKLIDMGVSDYSGTAPIIDTLSSATDTELFGVTLRGTTQGRFNATEIASVALNGTVVYLAATSALNRGTRVAADFATPGNVIAATSGMSIIGITLDKTVNAGELVRVLIATGSVA